MSNDISPFALATDLVHGGVSRSQFGETSEALFLTQGYVYNRAEDAEARFNDTEPGFVYSRYANPTLAMLEERMKLLEGAPAAITTSSGMAAVYASMMSILKAGDHVVAARALFGSCLYIVEEILPRFGVETTIINGTDLQAWHDAVRDNTKVLFFESPTNPTLDVIDIPGVVALAKSIGAKTVIDNVFATPIWQKPYKMGVDVVVYSATKHIDGQGRCLGGVILGDEDYIKEVFTFTKHTGPSMSPFNAWVMLKGLETLPLRVERQTSTAEGLAEALYGHDKLERMIYPGHESHHQREIISKQMARGSTMIALDIKGGKAGAFNFLNALKVVKISNNLGDAKSLITHPATTTHQRLSEEDRASLGITEGMVRLSIGLEDPEDLAADILQALEA